MNTQLKSKSATDLSIVIPAWNEATRLPRTLADLGAFAAEFPGAVEVIIADDGSTDDTPQVARHANPHLRLRVLSSSARKGPGHAVRRGVLSAQGERVLICDADGPVPFCDINPLWQAMDEGADWAVGSRVQDPATVLQPQPAHRVLMGKVWRSIAQQLVPTGVKDTQCGFKLMSRLSAQSVFSKVSSLGFGFHVEALFYAKKMGLRVDEIPVRWRDRSGSKINLLRDPLVMLREIGGIALRSRFGTKSWSSALRG